jgi:hypothetical protein
VEFHSKNKFEKLMHLVGFIIKKTQLQCCLSSPTTSKCLLTMRLLFRNSLSIFVSLLCGSTARVRIGCFFVEVPRPHIISKLPTQTYTRQDSSKRVISPFAEAATYTTHNEQSKGISLLSAGFEPAIPHIKRLQRYALDRATTVIGK